MDVKAIYERDPHARKLVCAKLIEFIHADLHRLLERDPIEFESLYLGLADETQTIAQAILDDEGNLRDHEHRLRQINRTLHVEAWR
jgi:hypothetical protein